VAFRNDEICVVDGVLQLGSLDASTFNCPTSHIVKDVTDFREDVANVRGHFLRLSTDPLAFASRYQVSDANDNDVKSFQRCCTASLKCTGKND